MHLLKSALALLLTEVSSLIAAGDPITTFVGFICPSGYGDGYCATEKFDGPPSGPIYYTVHFANPVLGKYYTYNCLGTKEQNNYCCKQALRYTDLFHSRSSQSEVEGNCFSVYPESHPK
ncbi:hypothetical protein MJO28_015600 [Puccinia striiformis f. sp. tritici]|uniref:Uncharacterized protein n=1 Tax=Puccinia striiformis f. sp. tritici TaxID=168172 RepID=A0ACC0DP55_9BASI|nr:hypothetical protein Pst134EA_029403 [Puccinia striiformis f. sp. tritici]KAI9614362.1 hypothetical protein H4Q26_009510 [Puccinia striiformis f. sp. tritici PST-130]KAH9447364.1 hypothetical protein Pst134EA_029403 [Puccinia striiformis f. sp. tritici]KAI7936478.1 hypothetical protein MJO29_015781 [Puccinia striiformis f. sp. tritici]KAI7936701.1 hypothetical protein MJO28_015600 [Puccinia striiformis f. sp. tritici]KAI9624219.1 hypothetical protein KEM48_009117 [Puccinia striiformis f. sp